jgi:hypothetical protein
MDVLSIIGHYLKWHYSRALGDIFHIWQNFIHFFYNFFSVGHLARTFIEPWHRLGEERRTKALDLEDIFEVVVVNIVMRLIGVVMRTILITFGIIFMLLTVAAGFLFYIFWLSLPVLVPLLFAAGIRLLTFS